MGFYQQELSVAGTTSDLPGILTFVEQSCAQAGIDPKLFFDLQLAVEEACCNVIEHAYEGDGGAFSIRFETRDRDAVITLHDHGRPFAPEKVAPPDMAVPLSRRPTGGLGLHLMSQLMDVVRFDFTAAGNTLVMIKRNAVLADSDNQPKEAHA